MLGLGAVLLAGAGAVSAAELDDRVQAAIRLRQAGNADAATSAYRAVIELAADHADSWLALGEIHDAGHDRLGAFLCYARFLGLEPESARSTKPAQRLWELLFQGVTRKGMSVTPPDDAEDPWWQANFMMSLIASMRDRGPKTDAAFFATALEGVTLVVEGYLENDRVELFWKADVIPYFYAAREAGHLEAMAYDIRRSTSDKSTQKWLAKHPEEIDRFRAWSRQWRPK